MENENSPLQIIDDVKSVFNQLPSTAHGPHAIPQMTYNSFGTGLIGFEALKNAFNGLDLSEAIESTNLDLKIKKQKKDLKELEKKHASLVSIFGEDGGASEGTLTRKLLETLETEVASLIQKRDELIESVTQAEIDSKIKIAEIDSKVRIAETKAKTQIIAAETKAIGKVRIIEQFSDFLAETNSNMRIYFWVIFFLVAGAGLTIWYSVPDLLKSYESYDVFIKSLGIKATPWQIINGAFGLFIVKLPWALCLSAVFTGLYSLIKGVLITYEKINQDKRNMSAIYAVSGNIAEALNEYGLSIADHENEDEETGEMYTVLRAPNKQINQKRESLKWNQIMNYFEGMQNSKNEVVASDDDPSKLKFATELFAKSTDLLGKFVDKLPKQ